MEYFSIPKEEAESLSEDFAVLLKRLKMDESILDASLERWRNIPYDIQFEGIRCFLGSIIREALALMRVPELRKKGVKIVYATVPLPLPILHALRSAGNGKIFVSTPGIVLVTFERLILFSQNIRQYNMDVGWNPACRHCMLNGSRFVYLNDGILAPPDLYIVASAVCDEAGKMDEMIKIQAGLSWETVLLKLPRDFENPDSSEDVMEYLKNGINEIIGIAKEWGVCVEEKHLKKGLLWWRNLSLKVYGLNAYVSKAPLQPMGGAALALVSSSLIMFMDTGSKGIVDVLNMLSRELRKAVKEKKGILPEGSPKVGFYFMPYLYPEIEMIFRKNNTATTFSSVFVSIVLDKIGIEANSSIEAIAKLWMRFPMTVGFKTESDALIKTIENFKPSAMIYGFLDFDRQMGSHGKMLAKRTSEACGIPTLNMNGDFWNPDAMNTYAAKERLESLCRILENNSN